MAGNRSVTGRGTPLGIRSAASRRAMGRDTRERFGDRKVRLKRGDDDGRE
jgi:hypothetical protein